MNFTDDNFIVMEWTTAAEMTVNLGFIYPYINSSSFSTWKNCVTFVVGQIRHKITI